MSERLEVMRELSQWSQKCGWAIYYNQKNPDGYPVFHANTNSKPDILLHKNNYNVLVEVKTGENHQDLLNGLDQTWKYTGEYYTGRSIYTINKQKNLKINAFVFATKYSRFGYLYENESSQPFIDYHHLTDELDLIEKPVTFNFTRIMWREWDKGFLLKHYEQLRIGKTLQKLPIKPRIGVMIAKTSKKYGITNRPYFYLNHNLFVDSNRTWIDCFES